MIASLNAIYLITGSSDAAQIHRIHRPKTYAITAISNLATRVALLFAVSVGSDNEGEQKPLGAKPQFLERAFNWKPHFLLASIFSLPKVSQPMGQALATVQEKFHGKQWREKQIRKITDKVYDRIRADCGQDGINFEYLYIAVLCVYNDINKHFPGPHNDPPTKAKLKAMMEEYDLNLDEVLDREEFAEFIKKLTAETVTAVGRNLIIALLVAPTVALLTKRATERLPGVGKVVHKVPNSVYASLVTLGVVLIQKSGEGYE